MMKASNHSYKIPNDPKSGYGGCCIIAIAFLSAIIFLCSCKVTKYVDRVEVKKDSAAIRQVDSLLEVKRSDSLNYEKVIELLSQNQIIFQDTGTTKIVYRSDGSIELLEGRVKSLNQRLLKSQQESETQKSIYDSLSKVTRKDSIITKTEVKTVKIEKKSGFPWFWLVVGLIAGFAIHNLLLAGLDWIDKRIKL